MKSMRSAFRVGMAILVLSLFLVGYATSPVPAPEHRYVVDGTLVRTGGDPGGYAVVLMGRFRGDTTLHVLRGESSSEADLSISGTDGNYFLQVSTPQKADSLAVAAFRSDRVSGISTVFDVDSSQAVELWETVRVGRESSGCGDCSTNSELQDRLVAFRYSYANVTVNLP